MMENKRLPSGFVQSRAVNKNKTTANAIVKGEIESGSEMKTRDNRLMILNDDGKVSETTRTSSNDRPSSSSDKPGSKATQTRHDRSNSASSIASRTPTKYVKLQAVRRKEDTRESSSYTNGKAHANDPVSSSTASADSAGKKLALRHQRPTRPPLTAAEDIQKCSHGDRIDNEEEDEEKEEKSSSGSDSEEVTTAAPNELMLEFLDCVMKADYVNAQKLCKMILIYEPENGEALRFRSLIDERIALQSAGEESDDEDDRGEEAVSTSEGDTEDSDSEDSESSDAEDDRVPESAVKL